MRPQSSIGQKDPLETKYLLFQNSYDIPLYAKNLKYFGVKHCAQKRLCS